MNSISSALSSRFRFVSSTALILVVIIHSKFIMSRWDGYINQCSIEGKLSWMIQFLLSENIARIAVPIFFFISGYFIAQNYDGSLEAYKYKIKKRIYSLLIPYLTFCFLWFIPYWIEDNTLSLLSAFIHPIPYQFWFIQHLMILSLSFGLIYKLKEYKYIILAIILILFLFSPHRWGGFQESLLFYTSGIYFSDIRYLKLKKLPLFFLIIAVTMVILGVVIGNNILIHHIMVLTGSMAVIFWIFSSSRSIKLIIPSGMAFFIFACHEPLLSILKTTSLQYGLGFYSTLLLYFTLPVITIFICAFLYKILNVLNQEILRIMVGNR